MKPLSRWNTSKSALKYIYPEYKKSYLIPDLLIFTTVFLCEIRISHSFNNTLSLKTYYVNKIKHGIEKEWYTNGPLLREYKYVNGIRNGLSKTWFRNGDIRSKHFYVNGLKNGRCKIWHDNGILKYDDIFINDLENGKCKEWDRKGNLVFDGIYINGDKHICTICNKSGINSVFDPCGHYISCYECSDGVSECPICHTSINKVLKIIKIIR